MFMIKIGNDYMSTGDPNNYIDIYFSKDDGSTKNCEAIIEGNNDPIAGKSFCVYYYTIKQDDFFDGKAYITTNATIPESIVFDNVGNGNPSENVHLGRKGSFWNSNYDENKNKIYIDSVGPKIDRAWIDMENEYGYKQGQ